ncbi:hypothetical protein TSUD_284720 [Trifolium subterraneum]|uniref:CRIB domain-containing protein n=1 Tax=Trifolium subterraneum TaxID=3900 RepID=A0A2Z6NQV4_TRISU|nr:hypothetical protein TSUD_284720 [Trifolium subterraneum]
MTIKGIYKGFKYITQIFVVKEEKQIEIGSPKDVKHVAHIGWDGPNGNNGPTWMNEFKTAPDFSTSIGTLNERNPNSTTNQDFEDPTGSQPTPIMYQGSIPSAEVTHNVPKKSKRKKAKSTTSPKSSSRQSRAPRSKGMHSDRDTEREGTIIADHDQH